MSQMNRRNFLKGAAALAAGSALSRRGHAEEISPSNAATLPKRAFGKTGVDLSIIGFGGIVVMNVEQADANRVVAESYERGVNYYDVAPGYGNAEEILGPALEPYRKDVFLATKTAQREREAAEEEFERSCERLKTDYFDLYQLHAITDVEADVDPVFQSGGVMDMIVEKQKEGRVRYIGFSAHSHEAALSAMDRYDFDSILFPFSYMTTYAGGFGPEVMQRAQEKNVACLCLKAIAKQLWEPDHPDRAKYPKCWYQPIDDPEMAALALRWALALPITSLVPPGEEVLYRMALDLAPDLEPALSDEEEAKLQAMADGINPLFTA